MRKLDRRSFLAQVAGGTIGGSALLVLGTSACATPPEAEAERRMIVDADPADPAREPPQPTETPPQTPEASPTPAPGISGLTDSDPTDRAGSGRGGRRRAGLTDSDSGPGADAAGSGRGGSARAAGGVAPRQSFVICPGHPRCPR
jgi:hypothetical protein